ncbi:MAG TPA: LuxR C-terminal-related transcriptional regulator [Caulobacteraceae bacterium]|jgi:DNA-binding CsgD family transcriptional regulator
MNAAIFLADTAEPVMETWLKLGRRARLILTEDLALHWCNAAGAALLERRDPLLLCGDAVRPRNLADSRRFQDFVSKAGGEVSVLCLANRDREEHLLAAAVRLPGRLVGVTASFASDKVERHWVDLREVFGLTACERDIAQALSTGLTAEAVAHKLNTSVKTVRTHIRHLYSKLGVCSREELFQKLTPYMITD